jgi:hypothetical protein
MNTFQIATFRADVTPPAGHPLCAGWMEPALGVADPIFANGVILFGSGAPIVLCAVDWCEISNRSYHAWQKSLADAVGTTPERVAVHTMHPHCTPWPDEIAQQLIGGQNGIRDVMDKTWCDAALARVAEAARHAGSTPDTATHVAIGRADVEKVASNRRIIGADGKSRAVRWTTTRDAAVRAEPEGLIDPALKTISFWNNEKKLAALHFYAVHPSSYEDRFVSPDFTGLARERRSAEEGVPHLYFTECAGNITAGKYNDGAHELREVFTNRIHEAMVKSEDSAARFPLQSLAWSTQAVQLPPLESTSPEELQNVLHDETLHTKIRSRAAFKLAYREREEIPIPIGSLQIQTEGGPNITSVHLPGESFIEYQLFAQAQRPNDFVVVPSYGDCGPGYICLEKSFAEGGYEPTDSFVAPRSEGILKDAIAKVLQNAPTFIE